ncbi:MAG: M24 family metallopeptidase [Desulfobacterales bacterium]|nr:M24 family metallopeptidase [Desulfobacterales bacterium]
MLVFEKKEFQERVAKTKAAMADQGVDVLLVTDPANINYLSGYDAWSFYTPQALIVDMDADEPVLMVRLMDVNCATFTTWMSQDNLLGYSDDHVQSPVKHPFEYLARIIRDKGLDTKVIGLETESYYFTARAYQVLVNELDATRFVNLPFMMNWIRIVKSPAEIEVMKKAGKLAEKIHQTALDAVEIGVRQCDVIAKIYEAGVSGYPEFGGDYPAFPPLMPVGEKSSAPHLTWSDDRLEAGQTLFLELCGCRNRYHSPLCRTISLGEPPQKVKDTADIEIEGLNAALETVKPGATCEEVEAAWRKTIARYGVEKESRIGYSIGVNYPPDWGEHTASLRPNDKTVLQPNMTFHMVPSLWGEGYGVEISESFRVTDTGYEPLSDFPRKLLVK